MQEAKTLSLGGSNTAVVHVKENSGSPPQVGDAVAERVDRLLSAYPSGPWPPNVFRHVSGPEIVQTIRLYAWRLNKARSEAGFPMLNPLELEQELAGRITEIPLPLQALCRWSVLVRIGVRRLQRDLLGLAAMIPLPSGGTMKRDRPTEVVGKTHYTVTHLHGSRFACRGYITQVNDAGEWKLGGEEGNRWLKDLWLTPGLRSVQSLVNTRRRQLPKGRPDTEARCQRYRKRIESQREEAGIKSSHFGEAYGARLDLENTAVIESALACVRAMLAQVLVYQADYQMDTIASRHGVTRSDILEGNVELAAGEAAAFQHHVKTREAAYGFFRSCGRFAIPQGYMVFSKGRVPPEAHEFKCEIPGVSGEVVPISELMAPPGENKKPVDIAALKRNAAALPEVENLTPLMDLCGVEFIDGKMVTDANELDLDTRGTIEPHMRYAVAGEDPVDMPKDEFLQAAEMRFLPMVVDFQRWKMLPDYLRGVCDHVTYELGHEDVRGAFACRAKERELSAS